MVFKGMCVICSYACCLLMLFIVIILHVDNLLQSQVSSALIARGT